MEHIPSKLLEDAVNEISKLPGIGKRTALRLALYLLSQDMNDVEKFSSAILRLRKEIKYCRHCHLISETDICSICSSPRRNRSLVCVVEDLRDVLAIENTSQYNGLYHVLGGIISPMDGIGPNHLNVDSLIQKAETENIEEVIMALRATMEGDTTVFYLSKKLHHLPIKISTIARGIAIGGELEYADEVTLGRSIINRIPYENSLLK